MTSKCSVLSPMCELNAPVDPNARTGCPGIEFIEMLLGICSSTLVCSTSISTLVQVRARFLATSLDPSSAALVALSLARCPPASSQLCDLCTPLILVREECTCSADCNCCVKAFSCSCSMRASRARFHFRLRSMSSLKTPSTSSAPLPLGDFERQFRMRTTASALADRLSSLMLRSDASRISRRFHSELSVKRCFHEICRSKSWRARSGVIVPRGVGAYNVAGLKVHSRTSFWKAASRNSFSLSCLRSSQA